MPRPVIHIIAEDVPKTIESSDASIRMAAPEHNVVMEDGTSRYIDPKVLRSTKGDKAKLKALGVNHVKLRRKSPRKQQPAPSHDRGDDRKEVQREFFEEQGAENPIEQIGKQPAFTAPEFQSPEFQAPAEHVAPKGLDSDDIERNNAHDERLRLREQKKVTENWNGLKKRWTVLLGKYEEILAKYSRDGLEVGNFVHDTQRNWGQRIVNKDDPSSNQELSQHIVMFEQYLRELTSLRETAIEGVKQDWPLMIKKAKQKLIIQRCDYCGIIQSDPEINNRRSRCEGCSAPLSPPLIQFQKHSPTSEIHEFRSDIGRIFKHIAGKIDREQVMMLKIDDPLPRDLSELRQRLEKIDTEYIDLILGLGIPTKTRYPGMEDDPDTAKKLDDIDRLKTEKSQLTDKLNRERKQTEQDKKNVREKAEREESQQIRIDKQQLKNTAIGLATVMAVSTAFYFLWPRISKVSKKTQIQLRLLLHRLQTKYKWTPGKPLPPQAQAELLAALDSLNKRDRDRLDVLIEKVQRKYQSLTRKVRLRFASTEVDDFFVGEVLMGLDFQILGELSPVAWTDGYTYTYIFPEGDISITGATETEGVFSCTVSYHSTVGNTSYSHLLQATAMDDIALERVIVEARHRIPSELLEEYTHLVCATQDLEGPDKLYAGRRLRQFQKAYRQGSYDEAVTLSGTVHG